MFVRENSSFSLPDNCTPRGLTHFCFPRDPKATATYMPSACWLRALLPFVRGGNNFDWDGHPLYEHISDKHVRLERLKEFLKSNPNAKHYGIESWNLWVNPICEAVASDFAESIPELVNAGFKIDSVSATQPASALYLAVLKGNLNCVKACLECDADPEMISTGRGGFGKQFRGGKEGETPVQLAQRLGQSRKSSKDQVKILKVMCPNTRHPDAAGRPLFDGFVGGALLYFGLYLLLYHFIIPYLLSYL